MRHLKIYEKYSNELLIGEFLSHVAMFFDSIKVDLEKDLKYNKLTIQISSYSVKLYTKYEYFKDRVIIECNVGKLYNISLGEKKPSKVKIKIIYDSCCIYASQIEKTKEYIESKIKNVVGFDDYGDIIVIEIENLEKLSKLKFDKEEMEQYLNIDRYNL